MCRFCGTGCGVQINVEGGRIQALRGDAEHPTTKGLVCAKALFLPKVVHSPDRLTTPQIRKNGQLVDASWEEAMELVSSRFADAIEQHGPDSVAYYGSGQCFSEESYLANRLFKGGIGTNNVEGNPRLCMASAVGGYVTTYGKDEPMGCYDDIAAARVFFLIGSNTAECHPVIFDQIMMARQTGKGVKIIMVDPRKTPVRAVADLQLAPIPGFDLAIFHAMAQVIIERGMHNQDFIDGKTTLIINPVNDRGDKPQSIMPVPFHLRPPSNYDWRSNPFRVNGGSGGLMLTGVDFRIDRDRIVALIHDAGFRAAQRTTDYRIVRTFGEAE